MNSSMLSRAFLAVLCCLTLLAVEAAAQSGPENKRCLTREQLLIEPLFSACPPLLDEASVSDNSFTAKMWLHAGPSTYTMRWLGEGYFSERNFIYDEDTGLYDGVCEGVYACSIPPGGWVEAEHWEVFVGTLLADNVGSWTYQELRDGLVFQSRTFDVRELELSALSGADQIGVVDEPLARPLRLQLESFEGIGIEDEVIGWELTGPGGAKRAWVSGIGSGSETDAEGIDEAFIRLGSKPGTYTLRLNNRRITPDSEPTFTFTAIDDIEDTDPVEEHPDFEEGVGENRAQQCDQVGNPVALSLGNKFQREADLEATGLSPIEFVRYHNSLGFVSDSFANYWTHTYDRYIEIPAAPHIDPVKVVRPDGRKVNFHWDGAGYRPFPGVHSGLEETADGWTWTAEDLTVETFDADGRLVEITDLAGRVQSATRDASGRLTRIDSNTGGSLEFTYDGSGRLESATDQAGRTWAYRYDTLGRLEFVDKPDGTSREYHYEDLRHAYALTGITLEDGERYSWYEYDDQGRAIASYHAGNADRVDIEYGADGDRIVLDPTGNATVYRTRIENKRGLLESISGPICSEGCGETDVQQTFDDALNVTSRTAYGVMTLFGDFDARGQPGYMVQAAGTAQEKRVDYQYDPDFPYRVTRISEPSVLGGESRVTTRTYDSYGNLLSETVDGFDPFGAPVSRTVSHRYDGPFGQITETDGPRMDVSDITRYEYYADSAAEGDNRARLRAIVDPNGIRVRDRIVYSPTGKILSEDRPNGVNVAYEYDLGSDRIRSLTESADGEFRRTRWEYTPAGDVERLIIDDESGAEIITRFSYDGARRLTQVESRIAAEFPYSAGQWVRYEFDAAGNAVAETAGSADTPGNDHVIERVFDAFNRIDTITRGGIVEDFDHDPDGTLRVRTDGNLNTTTYSYDALRRLTRSEHVGQPPMLFEYDMNGNRASVSAPGDQLTRFWHDDLDNLVKRDSPDTGVTAWTYNAAGQATSETDAIGQVATYSYDAAGRLTAVDRSGTDDDIGYSYDDCPNGVGRLCAVTSGWGHTTDYGWNAMGERVSVTTDAGQVLYSHGPGGALTAIEYPSGRTVRFENDRGGLPLQIRLAQPGQPDAILVQDIRYSPLGRPIAWRFANGLQTSIEMDARQRPRAIDIPGVMSWLAGAYDGNDNLLSRDGNGGAVDYAYDALDRLIASASPSFEVGFDYDAAGNRLSRTMDGAVEYGSYEPRSNRIVSHGDRRFTLDPNGSTIGVSVDGLPQRNYVYSGRNRLREAIDSVSSSALASYRYDALGQRVEKVTSEGVRRFLYGPRGELLVELDGAGNVLHEFVYLAGQPVVDLNAVPAVPPPEAAPDEIVVDDSEASVWGANWQIKSSTHAVMGTFLQNRRRENRAIYWYVDQPGFAGGAHDVFVRWLQPAGEGHHTNYDVRAGGQASVPVIIEHAAHEPGDWVLLGNFEFAPAGASPTQYVGLTGFSNDQGFEGRFLEADAVKLVPTFISGGAAEPVFIHGDHLGTPQYATDLEGTVIWTADYLPFGEATVDEDPDGDGSSYSLNIRFPGQYFDAETGLHYNYFRTYDPTLGRYLESDPIGLQSDPNTFVYVAANPLKNVDPSGLAYFAFRPLSGFESLSYYCSSGTIRDNLNIQFSHEHLFFEDGKRPSNLGFFTDGMVREDDPINLSKYRCRSGRYNDCIMRKAADVTVGGDYCFVGINGQNNCQDWAARVRANYAVLAKDPKVQKECTCP